MLHVKVKIHLGNDLLFQGNGAYEMLFSMIFQGIINVYSEPNKDQQHPAHTAS
jgi:hypothetical protein